MNHIIGKIFVSQRIKFDAENSYTRCGFQDCEIELDGSRFPDRTCTFQGCSFNIIGHAARTVGFLQLAWETPGMGAVIETVMTQVTSNADFAKQIVRKRKVS